MVGILRIPNSAAKSSFSSTSHLPTTIFPSYFSANSERIGDTIRQGPHHVAQKSNTRGRLPFFRDSKSFENFENDYKIDDNAYNLLPFEDEGQNRKNSKFDNDENWQDFKSLDMVLDESKELSEQKIFDEDPLDGKLIEGKLIGEISTKEQTPNKEIKVIDFKCEEKPIENFINNGNIKSIKPKEKIFEISKVKKTKKKLPKYPRIDDGKIYFRVKINKWFIKSLNDKIHKSDLSKELKKVIHSPNYQKFTEKVTAKSTYKDLEKECQLSSA